ncbi:MAG: beta-ketoacyl-[acyl-carrier-protein] synthase II, partial [Acidobacteriota bacterium]
HSLGAAGSVEFIATVLAMKHGAVPPTLGLEKVDPAFADLDLVSHAARPQRIRLGLSNSLAFGGNVASIAVEAPNGSEQAGEQ